MSFWVNAIRRWRRTRSGAIEFDHHGFQATRRGVSQQMVWSEVKKIEAFRIPTLMVEDFCIALSGSQSEPLMIDDAYPDFVKFQDEIWMRWPEIKDRWISIYCGNPLIAEHAILWERSRT